MAAIIVFLITALLLVSVKCLLYYVNIYALIKHMFDNGLEPPDERETATLNRWAVRQMVNDWFMK